MIDQDHQRFRQIVKGRIRGDLRKFLTRGELIGKEGKHLISIPVPGIEIPTFRYGDNNGGIGSGEGEEGQTVGSTRVASNPASTSWKSMSRWKNSRTSSAKSCICRASNPRAASSSPPSATNTRASAASGPNP